ncbi:MAG: DNA repair protein RecO C-terminal domain-containing protein [Gammaproteobacteria bacterium]|nr:DNA repair protein RecO C-terminal domain-containing protein [Gammaproteobacteria bacterium]
MGRTLNSTHGYLLLSRRLGEKSAWTLWFSERYGIFGSRVQGAGRAAVLPQFFQCCELQCAETSNGVLVNQWLAVSSHALGVQESLLGFYLLELSRVLLPQQVAVVDVYSALESSLHSLAQKEGADAVRAFELQVLLSIDALPDPTWDANGNAIEAHHHYQIAEGQWYPAQPGVSGADIIALTEANVSPQRLSKLCKLCIDHALAGRTLKTRSVLAQW